MTAEVVMTRQERTHLLPKIPDGVKTAWRDIDEKFVALLAGPCPLYIFHTCTVYAVRPFQCRRFGCLRVDPKTEPYEHNDAPDRLTGCKNADDRFRTSRVARRMMVHMQEKAQRWARQYGWS